ncbi:MAG: thioredoxin [Myxococcaceae bacterium]
MENVFDISDSQFKKEVLEANQPVLVDFGATWCAPCKAMDPIVHELAARYTGKVKVVKIGMDDNIETAQAYGVRSAPTILLFKSGKVVGQHVGALSKNKLEEVFQKLSN